MRAPTSEVGWRWGFQGLALGMLLLGPFTSAVVADSDGYYCATDRYLAYELRLNQSGHTLYVVRFGLPEGITQPAETVELEDFQVHGMACSREEIEVVSWDKRYTVDVTGTPRVTKAEEITPAERNAPELDVPSFFLGRETVGITTVARYPTGDRFLLVVSAESDGSQEGGLDHFRSAHLVWTGPRRNEKQVVELAAAFSFAPVH